MLQKLKTNRGGFTLVEIMIVVAIIALLAAIAVPNFLRARKRSQATAVLEEMRILDGAQDQYAIENNKLGSAAVTFDMCQPYLKVGTRLYGAAGVDSMGNAITFTTFDAPPTLDAATTGNFTDVVDDAVFWGSYKP